MSKDKIEKAIVAQGTAAGIGAAVGAVTKQTVASGRPMRGGLAVQVGSAVGSAAAQGASVGGSAAAGAAVISGKAAVVGAGAAKVAAVSVAAAPVALPALALGAIGYGLFRLFSDD
ncbi:MAG: hypothetical protein GY711_23110 [bacterium]|nr:hypothetical protein [bacterium]